MRLLVAAVLLSLSSLAATRDGLTPEQQRMKACNTRADQKQLQDGARKHFLTSCLQGSGGDGRKPSASQRRSEECNRRSRERRLEGAERRGFMAACEQPPAAKKTAGKAKEDYCNRGADERRLGGVDRQKYIAGCLSA